MNNGLDFEKFIHQYYSSEDKLLEIGFQNGETISAWIIGHFYSDEEFEAFFEGDLSPYMEDMLQNAQRITFEFAPKDKQVNLRFPSSLLETVKATAKAQGMSYQRYIRKAVEESLPVAPNKMAE